MTPIATTDKKHEQQETNLRVTLSELWTATDALDGLSAHYHALAQDLAKANCSMLLKDLQESQKVLFGLQKKVQAAQDELYKGDEFK